MLKDKKTFLFNSVLAFVAMLFLLSGSKVLAAEKFIDNPHWVESLPSQVNTKYYSGDKFIVMFYRPGCIYCSELKAVLDQWMTDYNFDIYGVNIDTAYIPSWAYNASYEGSNNTPYICLVDGGAVTASFRGTVSNETLANGISEFQGVNIVVNTWTPILVNETVDVIIEVENRQTKAREVFDAVNAYRKENGKPEFKYNYNLEKDAIKRAVEYAVYSDISITPDGRVVDEELYAKGVYQAKTALSSQEDILADLTGKGFFETVDTLTEYEDAMAIGYIHAHMADYWVIYICLSENAGEYTEPESGLHYYTVPTNKDWINEVEVYAYTDTASKIYKGSSFNPNDCISQKNLIMKGRSSYGSSVSSTNWVIIDSIPEFTRADEKHIVYENGVFKAVETGVGKIYGTLCGKDISVELEVKEDPNKTPEPTPQPVDEEPAPEPTSQPVDEETSTEPISQPEDEKSGNTVTVGKPTIKVKSGSTGNSVKLTISKTKGAKSYNVYMIKTSGSNKTKSYELISTVKKGGTKKRSITIKNLSAGTYKFKVEAVGEETDASGEAVIVKKMSKVKKIVLKKK